LRLAAPHFLRMTRLVDRLAPVPQEDAPLLAALDAQGSVTHVTRRAQALLAERDGLDLAARGLSARQPAAQRRIEAMIAGALRRRDGTPDAPAPTVLVPRPSCRPSYVVQAMALPARRGGGTGTGTGACAVLVTILDPVRGPRPRREAVRAVFGLTPAEAEVALRIFDGGGLAQAARETGIAVSTLRTHLLHVFEKTGVHRQADLVRLLASLAPEPGDQAGSARPLRTGGRPRPASGTPQAGPARPTPGKAIAFPGSLRPGRGISRRSSRTGARSHGPGGSRRGR
jgi:DNA-binding CsgD family transcriptional regulator